MEKINIIFYILFYIAFLIILYYQIKDINCPNPSSPLEDCGEGKGGAYYGGKSFMSDSISTILSKIKRSSQVLVKTIFWRQAFVSASIINTILWTLVIGHLPDFSKFLSGVLLSMFVIYFFSNFNQFHHYQHPFNDINESLIIIRKKLEI